MKSYIVHLMAVYFGMRVDANESMIRVYSNDNELLCVVAKTGLGSWECAKDLYGARDAFSLAAIPKNTRVYKLFADGSIGRSEEFEERKAVVSKLMRAYGRVPSIPEIQGAMDKARSEKKEAMLTLDRDMNVIFAQQQQPAPQTSQQQHQHNPGQLQ